MSIKEKYEYFWDGSSPEWCLLELKPYSEDVRNFLIFNCENPTEMSMINWRYRELVEREMLRADVRIILLSEKLNDPVREFSRRKGYSNSVICGSFDYLLERWEAIVKKVKFPKSYILDEYLNDMSSRDVLEELLNVFPSLNLSRRTHQLDFEIREVLQPISVCIFGSRNAKKYNYTPEQHWYYFMLPAFLAEEWEEIVRQRYEDSEEEI